MQDQMNLISTSFIYRISLIKGVQLWKTVNSLYTICVKYYETNKKRINGMIS
jgi:hypothetical protein